MPNSTSFATIFSTIEEELDLFSALHEILEKQQKHILSRDGRSLSTAAETITQLLEEARQFRIKRSDHLKKAGFDNSPTGMTEFFQRQGSAVNQKDWQELVELVEQCKALNLKNGETLRIQREHTDKQLRRFANRQQKTSYSASGQSVVKSEPTLRVMA
ncbi:hypothetical protein ACH42_06830 [Endozoicomonas sp. (ex Bugula neritina AB1)]|nr:hypothetical protein ACH42_06830 [Endozoicomonas sp. (ex Bugula neritina AB1)]